jgi:PadR family transcriptional regulator PadR
MKSLSAYQRDQLWVIAGGEELIGKTIRELLEEYRGERTSSSRLYPNLNELVDKGLVEKKSKGRENFYHITEDGKQMLEERLNWEENQWSRDQKDAHQLAE